MGHGTGHFENLLMGGSILLKFNLWSVGLHSTYDFFLNIKKNKKIKSNTHIYI